MLRKEKKGYFTSLNEEHIIENKCFWETVKPFLSNKVQSSERMKLCEENDTLIKEEVAMELNDFFSNAVINLKIPKFENFDPLSESMDHRTVESIVKYIKHPSIIVIASEFTRYFKSHTGYRHTSKGNQKQHYFFLC